LPQGKHWRPDFSGYGSLVTSFRLIDFFCQHGLAAIGNGSQTSAAIGKAEIVNHH